MNSKSLKEQMGDPEYKLPVETPAPQPKTMTPEMKAEIQEFVMTLPPRKKPRFYKRAVERKFKIKIVAEK